MTRPPRRPRDPNQLAKFIVDVATGETSVLQATESVMLSAAAELGRRGGLKGGKARAAKLSPEKRSEIAAIAAKKRWAKDE